jgi:hypothetical protein
MSQVHKIKIKNGNYSTGELTLSDGGHTRADKTDYVNWSIQRNATNKVASIENIQIKTNNPSIFSTNPHANGEEWSAEIDYNALYNAECYYSICWKGKDGKDYIHDPKISVKPSSVHRQIIRDTLLIFSIILGIFTWNFWRKNSR